LDTLEVYIAFLRRRGRGEGGRRGEERGGGVGKEGFIGTDRWRKRSNFCSSAFKNTGVTENTENQSIYLSIYL